MLKRLTKSIACLWQQMFTRKRLSDKAYKRADNAARQRRIAKLLKEEQDVWKD